MHTAARELESLRLEENVDLTAFRGVRPIRAGERALAPDLPVRALTRLPSVNLNKSAKKYKTRDAQIYCTALSIILGI
jgi:hypothetical protein